MELDKKNIVILITGASKGIGHFLFNHFDEKKISVYGTYNSSIKAINPNKSYSKVDITNISDVKNWVNNIKISSKIILINCAGISYNSFFHKSDHIHWKKVVDVNLIGTYNVIRTIIPLMRENNYGRIINFSSVTAIKPTPGISAYAASKSALWGLAKSLSIENASRGITINNINLGYSELGMISQVPTNYMKIIKSQIPSGKLCEKKDILNCIYFLINNKYLNGSSVDLNGGLV